ncbi:hypothetical protein O7599_32590 [Streptomyces sp. WMMC500]|uniref:hypothetical protein n=1 Tax=Streptomyces sp. WMMC500 TaxID=3015154 RepID=UPI00248CB53B|nr:hypothetical protein [Streptomyces sp. WMMC500]WBB60211.1 hypothetical protein O7599_32590 [Streptomyces sp. WMMC500]
MNTAARAGLFAGTLAVAFAGAYGVGSAVGPVTDEDAAPAHGHAADEGAAEGAAKKGDGHGGGHGADAGPAAGGLQLSESGYTLDLDTARIGAPGPAELRFAVRGADGEPVTAYEREHGKELHLIVASRDLGTYRHLHPVRDAAGTWRTPVDLPGAGDYRVFADFVPTGGPENGLTLGGDLAVAGDYRPAPPAEPERTATVDGYEVTLDGALTPGSARDVEFTVEKDGRPVTDLQPYLGAYGHLVALRAGDLAYLHVHPGGEPGDGRTEPGPGVAFSATAPSTGSYRLFFDFKHDGEVRTAAFTVTAGGGAAGPGEADGGGHGH